MMALLRPGRFLALLQLAVVLWLATTSGHYCRNVPGQFPGPPLPLPATPPPPKQHFPLRPICRHLFCPWHPPSSPVPPSPAPPSPPPPSPPPPLPATPPPPKWPCPPHPICRCPFCPRPPICTRCSGHGPP